MIKRIGSTSHQVCKVDGADTVRLQAQLHWHETPPLSDPPGYFSFRGCRLRSAMFPGTTPIPSTESAYRSTRTSRAFLDSRPTSPSEAHRRGGKRTQTINLSKGGACRVLRKTRQSIFSQNLESPPPFGKLPDGRPADRKRPTANRLTTLPPAPTGGMKKDPASREKNLSLIFHGLPARRRESSPRRQPQEGRPTPDP